MISFQNLSVILTSPSFSLSIRSPLIALNKTELFPILFMLWSLFSAPLLFRHLSLHNMLNNLLVYYHVCPEYKHCSIGLDISVCRLLLCAKYLEQSLTHSKC